MSAVADQASRLDFFAEDPRLLPFRGLGLRVLVRCGNSRNGEPCPRRVLVLSPDEPDLIDFDESPHAAYSMNPSDADRERLTAPCHPKHCGAVYPLVAETVFDLLLSALEHGEVEVASLADWLRFDQSRSPGESRRWASRARSAAADAP